MSLFMIYEAPKIISSIFCPFLTIFTLFHLQFLLYSKNLQQIISGTPQFLIGLVNNARNQCQKLYKIFGLLNFLQRRCEYFTCVFSNTGPPGPSTLGSVSSPAHFSLVSQQHCSLLSPPRPRGCDLELLGRPQPQCMLGQDSSGVQGICLHTV